MKQNCQNTEEKNPNQQKSKHRFLSKNQGSLNKLIVIRRWQRQWFGYSFPPLIYSSSRRESELEVMPCRRRVSMQAPSPTLPLGHPSHVTSNATLRCPHLHTQKHKDTILPPTKSLLGPSAFAVCNDEQSLRWSWELCAFSM